jgi:ABC-type spermidine/putrescine transport system permease subunit II
MASALSRDVATETVAIKIYGAARTSPSPAANALGTIMLVTSTVVIGLAVIFYRHLTRGERR